MKEFQLTKLSCLQCLNYFNFQGGVFKITLTFKAGMSISFFLEKMISQGQAGKNWAHSHENLWEQEFPPVSASL